MMRVLLIEPGEYIDGRLFKTPRRPTRSVALTLPFLAALMPEGWEVDLSYEVNEDTLNKYEAEAYDLIGLTVQTFQMRRALELLRILHGTGPRLIVGGPATVEDDHRLVRVLGRFADSVIIGHAERTWPQALSDFCAGQLAPQYQDELPPPVVDLPPARFDLMDLDQIREPHVLPVITARGCPRRCTFCSEFLYGSWQKRPVEDVHAEIVHYRDKYSIPRICFRDDDFLVDPKRTRELLRKVEPEGITWACQTDFNVARHPDVLNLAVASGMRTVSFGLESVREANREWTEKTFFTIPEAKDVLLELYARGVETQVNVIFGFDHDDPDIFDETWEFLEQTKVSRFFPSILFPIPGTPLFDSIRSEGRLFAEHPPGIEDELQVLFEPKNMTSDELVHGFLDIRSKFEQADHGHRQYWLGRDVVVV